MCGSFVIFLSLVVARTAQTRLDSCESHKVINAELFAALRRLNFSCAQRLFCSLSRAIKARKCSAQGLAALGEGGIDKRPKLRWARSEERRVGKECRCRLTLEHVERTDRT